MYGLILRWEHAVWFDGVYWFGLVFLLLAFAAFLRACLPVVGRALGVSHTFKRQC